jgi:hypothetical protein
VTRKVLLAAASLMSAGVHAPAAGQGAESPLLRAPDHVLVWSETAGAAERMFTELGFNVRAGQVYPEGITASTITFADWSYLELLHFSDPTKGTGNARAMAELAFVADGPGANSLAIQVDDVDAAAERLKREGFAVADVDPDMVDPDGAAGPAPPKPASWQDFHFGASPVAGVELFFIEYPPDPRSTPEAEERFRARTTHPNGALRLSAVWVLVPDLDAEAETYRRIGFEVAPAAAVPQLNARARVADLGGGAVILVESDDLPPEFETPRRTGPRVIGLSFETEIDAEIQARPRLREAARRLSPVFQSQTVGSLGFFIQFHDKGAMPLEIAP